MTTRWSRALAQTGTLFAEDKAWTPVAVKEALADAELALERRNAYVLGLDENAMVDFQELLALNAQAQVGFFWMFADGWLTKAQFDYYEMALSQMQQLVVRKRLGVVG